MIFSKKFRKTAASVLALVMVFAMSTGAFAYGGTGTKTDAESYYNVTVSYEVTNASALPENAQISIIALEGYAENADAADVKVTFNGDTANNVLWIDQQAAAASGTFTFQVDAAKVADNGFHVKSGVTGGETMFGYVTVGSTGGGTTTPSSDASLASLTVGGQALTAEADGTYKYTLAANAASVVVDAVANDSKATVAGDGTINLVEGENTVTITVTAEDGTEAKYTLKITNPEAGTVTPPAGGTEIPKEDITIGGNKVTDATAPVVSTTPFGIEDGHVVKVEVEPAVVDGEVQAPTQVLAHEGKTDGVETFYTEYEIEGKTVIKLVTVITDPDLKASDLTLVDSATAGKTATKLEYMDVNGDGTIDSKDVGAIIPMGLGMNLPSDLIGKLRADVNGDGVIDSKDVGAGIPFGLDSKIIPNAAK